MADVALTTLAMTQGTAMFFTMLPRYVEVKEMDSHSSQASTVRHAELAATVATIGVGILLSSLSGDGMPLKVSVVIAFGFVLMYEVALRTGGKVVQDASL